MATEDEGNTILPRLLKGGEPKILGERGCWERLKAKGEERGRG